MTSPHDMKAFRVCTVHGSKLENTIYVASTSRAQVEMTVLAVMPKEGYTGVYHQHPLRIGRCPELDGKLVALTSILRSRYENTQRNFDVAKEMGLVVAIWPRRLERGNNLDYRCFCSKMAANSYMERQMGGSNV